MLYQETFLRNNLKLFVRIPLNKCSLFSLGTCENIFAHRLGIALNGCQGEEQESADSEDLHG